MPEIIIGIDLGTTNSEVAAYLDGKVQVLPPDGDPILPSVVGLASDGSFLVGDAARNQFPLFPERTIRSIKRKMGTSERFSLGDASFTPPEISAFILRALKERAEKALGASVGKAVITVPAFFSDAQRQATREAGAIAGLDVVRILNEPTAAALAYGEDHEKGRTVLVYDLGGGTFDVSIVHVAGDVLEVLASHGDTHLGGDDFDDLLLGHVKKALRSKGITNIENNPRAMGRLLRAVEEAKKRLSFEPHARIREENLAEALGVPVHADLEVSRETFEGLIGPLLEKSLESVSQALTGAKKTPAEIDDVLLVGGATRTPLVSALLEERFGMRPRQDLHPDLCVALGAGVLASRMAGHAVDRILVDVSPYSFGTSVVGLLKGFPSADCYSRILARNTPLPSSRTEGYFTMVDDQEAVDIRIYQGEDPDARRNILIGNFLLGGLSSVPAGNEILCRFDLDLDGILNVTATEKKTGRSAFITIERATSEMSPEQVFEARRRMSSLLGEDGDEFDLEKFAEEEVLEEEPALLEEESPAVTAAKKLLEKSAGLLPRMTQEDREDVIRLNETIETAIQEGDEVSLERASDELADILFFVEER